MTLVDALVSMAFEAADAPPTPDLRPAVITDLAATVGKVGTLVPRLEAVVDGDGPAARAFRLAARMHARTQDDFYPAGKVHVGATVVPAVLAVGSPDVLAASAAGFAVTKTLSHVYRSEAQARGFRPTGLFAPMGAAAAAGIGLGLSRDELAAAIAIASAISGGTNQSWISGTDEWLVEVATATRAGVEAALLAQAGVVGAPVALEGPAGWANAFFADPGAERLGAFTAAPSLGAVAVKPYPVSGIAQVPSAAAAELGRQLGAAPARSFVVRVTPTDVSYPGSTNRGPFQSRSDSLMSIARCAALAYLHGAIALEQLDAPPSPDEQALLNVIELVPDVRLAEEEVEVTVDIGTEVRSCTLTSRDVLYPSLDELVADLAGLARRSEAPTGLVEELAGLMQADSVGAASIVRALGETT